VAKLLHWRLDNGIIHPAFQLKPGSICTQLLRLQLNPSWERQASPGKAWIWQPYVLAKDPSVPLLRSEQMGRVILKHQSFKTVLLSLVCCHQKHCGQRSLP